LIQVTGKLTVGQHVVVEGNERLKSGQQVRVMEIIATNINTPNSDR